MAASNPVGRKDVLGIAVIAPESIDHCDSENVETRLQGDPESFGISLVCLSSNLAKGRGGVFAEGLSPNGSVTARNLVCPDPLRSAQVIQENMYAVPLSLLSLFDISWPKGQVFCAPTIHARARLRLTANALNTEAAIFSAAVKKLKRRPQTLRQEEGRQYGAQGLPSASYNMERPYGSERDVITGGMVYRSGKAS
ncbi:hypothetical protein B0H12DRAFT_1311307 [Mycena haematopus]|nr:hypothetical protein B0H12DRAFT_1311307 [Mycena haematopus]